MGKRGRREEGQEDRACHCFSFGCQLSPPLPLPLPPCQAEQSAGRLLFDDQCQGVLILVGEPLELDLNQEE